MPRRRGWMLSGILLASLTTTSCMTWSNVSVPTAPAPMQTYSGLSRVTTVDRRSMELHNVVTISDSLFGLSGDVVEQRVSMPLSSVSRIEHRVKSTPRTLIALGLGLAVIGFTNVAGVGFK